MWMSWKLAWRNLFRNRRRTWIAGTAIGLGLAALMFTDALMLGMADHMVHSATASFMGEAQVHAVGYRESRDESRTIPGGIAFLQRMERDERVDHAAPRVLAAGTLASPSDLRPVQMVGVDVKREPFLSQFDDVMMDGRYLSGTPHEIVIGSRLARLLSARVGSRLVMTVAQPDTGELAQALFRVRGIYRFGAKALDEGLALVSMPEAQQLLAIPDRFHEIALTFRDHRVVANSAHPFYRETIPAGIEIVGWQTLMPQLAVGLKLINVSMLVVALILFAVVALGIVNTLFMSIYERMFEFGVLRAVGTRPGEMARLILLEAVGLGLLSVVLGMVLGAVATAWVAQVGVDYRGIEMMGVTMREVIVPRFSPVQFWKYPLWVLGMTVTVAVYPAWYAARLSPTKAMRRSM